MRTISETAKSDCPFCAIAAGSGGPVELIDEAESWIAFFPESPATPGHTLIVPREHVPDLWAAGTQLAGTLSGAAIRIGSAIELALQPQGMNLITSKGEAGEQTVRHLHLHLVPRWSGDAVQIWPEKASPGRAVKAGLADQIRAALPG